LRTGRIRPNAPMEKTMSPLPMMPPLTTRIV
jgi:hypothetical protein